jgi:catechol 2,3-dioxygenase-like lactoylglutathione lyase family enzyme
MSLIKVEDIEFIRFSAPDLQAMRVFLLDFGLTEIGAQPDGVLRMRAMGSAPVVHETELGQPGFRAIGFRASSLADLDLLAAQSGARVEDNDRPGGGKLVRLTDPNGFLVEIVAGGQPADPVPYTGPHFNFGTSIDRPSEAVRVKPGPSKVLRLGHAVFTVNNLDETWRWWRDTLGFVMSDDVKAPDGTSVAVFIRCDRGEELTDHHTLNFATMPGRSAEFHHAAFEVADIDSLMAGNAYLLSKGHRHAWGVGRHVLGSQIFDYWFDPFGHRIEHWTDGDQFTTGDGSNVTDLETMIARQWGPDMPGDFV